MKYVVALLAIAGAFLGAGCDKPVCDCPAFPNGDTVAVRINQKESVYSCCKDQFALSFMSVKEDSRCPDGFNCVAMGNLVGGTARIVVRINGVQMVELHIGQPKAISAGHDYTLLLTDLTPHPKSGLPTDPNTYEAMIVVNRN